ncbi:MAG: polyprenol monophosphomannose synthase [Anaerolineales bacterium]
MNLFVITPTYNEAQNIPSLANQILALPVDGIHLLIVDDNSPDGTGQIAEKLREKIPESISVIHRTGKFGLGSAYIEGIKKALLSGAHAIAQIDADLSHPPELLVELYESLDHADVALGSRYIAGGSVDKNWPFWRKSLSAFGNFYARTILNLPVRDVTGGFRVWRSEVLRKMPLNRIRSNGYAFLIELTYVANLLNFSFVECPFYFPNRESGRSKMSLRIQLEAAYRVWRMRWEYRDLIRVD